jgi:four helix bundle protein
VEPIFDHEKLQVYALARQFNREIHEMIPHLTRGNAESRDNLQRAAKSITRNIAEGSGRWNIPDKVHFYRVARASATECAASLDELVDFNLIAPARLSEPRRTLVRVVSMLTAMIRSMEARTATNMTITGEP